MGLYDFDIDEPPTTSTWAAPGADPLAKLPTADQAFGPTMSRLGTLFDAAKNDAEYNAVASGKTNAMADAIDARNKTVRDATGIVLDNPLNGGYIDQANVLFNQRYGNGVLKGETPDDSTDILAGMQMDAYTKALAQVRQQHPEIPELDTPLDQATVGVANQASASLAQAQAAAPGAAGTIASVAGGLVGAFRDPINVLSMAVPVGGEMKAATLFGRVVSGALEGAAVNAGITALAEPSVQSFQAERGLETGLLPAAKDIGASMLLGAAFGGAGGVLHHAFAGTPALAGRAIGGDLEAASAVAERVPAAVAPELHAAIGSEVADRAVMADAPAGLKPQDAAQATREAIRFGEDPDAAPLPAMPPDVPPETTDGLARQVLEEAPAGAHPLDVLRADPAAVTSALSSDNANLRMLGRVASLSDEAAQAVRDGVLPPEMAQHIAATVADPAEQLSVLQAVAARAPQDEASARSAITAEVQARATPEATSILLGGDPGGVQRSGNSRAMVAKGPRERARAANPPKPQSLVAFLRSAGGLRDEGGNLRGRDLHKQFPTLVRTKGLALDRAREMAAEAGYLGPDIDRAMAETTPNDLLEAIERHPVYSVYDQHHPSLHEGGVYSQRVAARQEQELYEATRAGVREDMRDAGLTGDPVLEHAVTRYMIEHGVPFDEAIEPTVMAMDLPERTHPEADYEVPFDDPPSEGGQLPRPGEPGAERGEPVGAGTAGEPVRDAGAPGATERTDAGEQGLIPGVSPVSTRERLQARTKTPLRGGDASPPAGGLFDIEARKQVDLLDMVPLAERDDGADMRVVHPDDLDGEPLPSPAREAASAAGSAEKAAADDFALRLRNRNTGETAQALHQAPLRDMLSRFDVVRDETVDGPGRISHLVVGRALADRIGDMKVFTVDAETMRLMQQMRPGERPAIQAGGLYVPWDNHILVRADELRDPANASRLLLHEGLHGAYFHAIEQNHNIRTIVENLRTLAEAAHVAAGGAKADHYGLTNAHEFVSEAFTQPRFQQFLAGVEAPDRLVKAVGLDQASARRSLWDVFIGGLRKLLGLGPEQHTLLDALTRVIGHIDERAYPEARPDAGAEPLPSPRTTEDPAVAAERQRRTGLAAAAAKQIAADVRGYRGPDGRPDIVSAIGRLFENVGHTGYGSVRGRFNALFGGALSEMGDALHTFGRDPVTLRRRNAVVLDDVARAAFGEAADPKAKAFYEAWLKPNEKLRQLFNAAGGAIGWRDDWGLPQGHDAGAVLRAGFDAWRAYIEPRLDWDRMARPATDTPIAPAEREDVLRHVWRSIVMDGWNTREPSAAGGGTGALATTRNDPRFLVMKNANAWLDYNKQFGTGNVFDTMMRHTQGLSRDVAAMQRLGPNPGATVQWLKQIIDQEGARYAAGDATTYKPGLVARAGNALGADGALGKSVIGGQRLVDSLYEMARGSGTPHSLLDEGLTMFRNLQTSAKLGSAVALHATVNPVLLSTALAHYGLPVRNLIGDVAKSFAGAAAHEIASAGMIVNDAMHSLEQGARQAGAMSRAAKWTEWLPTTTLHYSGLEGGVAALRRAWWWGASSGVAGELGKAWGEINPRLRRNLLEGFGLTERDWRIMQAAKLYQPSGQSAFLRFQDIRDAGTDETGALRIGDVIGHDAGDPDGAVAIAQAAESTSMKYLEMLHSAMEFAVPSSRWRSGVALQAGTRPGTIARSVLQSFAMFKGFIGSATVSYLEAMRHELANNKTTAAAAAGGLAIALTAMGTLALQLKTLSNGKDLLPMDPTSPEGRATLEHGLLTSGALGIFGDYLNADQSSYGHGFLSELAGPQVTGLADSYDTARSVLHRGSKGEIGAAAVKLLRNNTPVLSTHWALRAAYNRILLDQLQYLADPKAHQSMRAIESRVQKDTGQDFWWRPGDLAPSRFPQMTPSR